MTKLTPARRKALQWIADHEPVGSFPCDGTAPQLWFVRKLLRDGLLCEAGREPTGGFLAFTRYVLSSAGRDRLREEEAGS